MKHLVECFPEATTIRVFLDDLNKHKPTSLYEAFPPEEARAIARKLEFHYTPRHGSWLNIAEMELAVLSKMCLSSLFPTTRPDDLAIDADGNIYGIEDQNGGRADIWFLQDVDRDGIAGMPTA